MKKLKELKLKTAQEVLRLDELLKNHTFLENKNSIMYTVVEFQLGNKRDLLTLIECVESIEESNM